MGRYLFMVPEDFMMDGKDMYFPGDTCSIEMANSIEWSCGACEVKRARF